MDARTILGLYEQRGLRAAVPGGVSPLQHGWQCARLARAAGASPSLQLAAWLHDLGHLVPEEPGHGPAAGELGEPASAHATQDVATRRRHRNLHALRGAALLLPLFGPTVSGPVAMHIEAKRCLAALRPAYRRALTSAALHQLALQGGAMPPKEARAFLQRPQAPAALRLRLWDDAAHDPEAAPPSVGAALDTIARLMRLLDTGSRVLPARGAPSARTVFLPPQVGQTGGLPGLGRSVQRPAVPYQ